MADKYAQADRDKMAKSGQAMPDGSYPIADHDDLAAAIKAVGRGAADHDKIRKHIIGRAKALNMMNMIPDNWNSDGSMKNAAGMSPLNVRMSRAEAMRGVRETRRLESAALEVRSADSGLVTFTGLASRTATPYDMGSYSESISRGAFGETLKRNPDVTLLINHEGLPLARSSVAPGAPGSLRLFEDTDGLQFEALCDPADPDVQKIRGKVDAGLLNQCSFAFRVLKQTWRWMEDTGADADQRDIQEVSLDRGDVSIVTQGANPTTTISARALLMEMSDEELASLPEEFRARLAERADSPGGANPMPYPGCGCCPNCKGATPQQNAAPCHEVAAAEHSLDYYMARAYNMKLPRR